MENLMKAICLTTSNGVKVQDVPKPEIAQQGHLLIKMAAAGSMPGIWLLLEALSRKVPYP